MPTAIMVRATRTVRLRISESADAGVGRAVESTRREWDKAVHFYADLFLGHPDVYREKKTVVTPKGEKREVAVGRQGLPGSGRPPRGA